MWERGARHYPWSWRNIEYLDHRPFLPQDKTHSFYRKEYDDYEPTTMKIKTAKGLRYLYLNNIPAADRENIKLLYSYYAHILNVVHKFSFVPAVFLSGFMFKTITFKWKILYPIMFYINYLTCEKLVLRSFYPYFKDNMSYYTNKYTDLTVERLADIDDPRRKHFRVDTSVYYRETPEEIQHAQHQGEGDHHDTSGYFGPLPVCYIYNI